MIRDTKVGFAIALSSLRRGNKKTFAFIIMVLALIFVNLVFLPSLIDGMMGVFVGAVTEYTYGDIVVEPTGQNLYINNANSVLKKIRSVNGVRSTSKRLEGGTSIQYKHKIVGVNMIGVVPEDEKTVSQYPHTVVRGEFLEDTSRDEIILGAIIGGFGVGSEIYDNLEGVRVGSLVDVQFSNGVKRTYKVKGFHQGGAEMSDLNAVIHYKEIEEVLGLTGEEKATSIITRTHKGIDQAIVKQKIIDVGVKEQVFTWQEKAEALIKQAVESMGIMTVMSKYVSLIVGAALIFIIIYINTLNRKREIGILKAIGISPQSIIVSYMFISMFYVTLGILVGLGIFLGLVAYMQANPISFYETWEFAPIVNYPLLIQSTLTMLAMSMAAGFIPAWLVTRESILNAIWGR